MDIFAKREKMLREELKFTIEDVSRGTGLTTAAISRYENGLRTPNASTLSSFCLFYNVSADYLIGLVDGKNEKYGK